jgi:murein DD-endopeptidase MepM/ murein hydrolase activator NlpD
VRKSQRKASPVFLLVLLLLIALGVGVLWWLQSVPGVHAAFTPSVTYLGQKATLNLFLASARGEIESVEVTLVQGAKATKIGGELVAPPLSPQRTLTLTVDAKALGLQEGAAQLEVSARDSFWRPFGQKKQPVLSHPVTVDYTPPTLEALSVTQYVHQGGGGLVVYRAKGAEKSGVSVGSVIFPGVSGLGADPSLFVALFAIPYDAPTTTPVLLTAEDEAGNSASRAVGAQILPRKFKTDTVRITEAFLKQKLPELLPGASVTSGDQLLQGFLTVNRDKRKEADERIRAVTRTTEPKPLWAGVFTGQKNAKVFSNFAEQRTYLFDGKAIDSQVHMGYDLASTRESPVTAANRGKVVLAEPLTIYGNTVILDHGLGLATLYGHLSGSDVKVGQVVEKGGVLGRSGATGLAIGDHLHFTVLIHGVPVTPLEWWDAKWIKEKISQPLEFAGIALSQQ